jgi:hypothetical protein
MTAFDPYHVWLGIPLDEQPANQYRLLGLRTFESNADVIDHAADRQMAHLRSFSAGERAGIAQKLLNEVAAARVCLLDAAKKAEYDARLRAALMPAKAPVTPPMAVPPSVRPAWKHAPIPAAPVAPPSAPLSAGPSRPTDAAPLAVGAGALRRRKSAPPIVPIVVVGLLVVGCIVALNAMNSSSSDPDTKGESPSVASQDDPPKSPDRPQTPMSLPAVSEADLNKPPASPSPGDGNEPPEIEMPVERPPDIPETPEDPDPPPDERPPEMPQGEPEAPFEDLLNGNSPDSPGPESVPENRPPVPDEAARAAKEKEIRALLTKEFAQSKPQEIWEFGRTLLALAHDTKNDPVGRYVIYRLTIDRAAKSGDAETARAAAEQIAKEYDVDRLDTVGGAILAVARGGVPVAVRPVAMQQATELAKQTFAGDRLGLAKNLTEEWLKLAGQLRDADASVEAREYKERVAAASERWPDVAKSLEILDARPEDGAANAVVGRYRCFIKGEWDRGLENLAKSDDVELKPLAAADLAARGNPNASVDVADRWVEFTKKCGEAETPQVVANALNGFVNSLGSATGLTKTRAAEGLENLQRNHGVWLDLLATINPQRDKAAGDWTKTHEGDISGAIRGGTGSLNTFVEPTTSYEFKSEFTRLGPSGDIFYFVPVGESACVFAFSGYDNSVSWIDAIDGHCATNKNPTLVRPPRIASGVRHELHATIRLKGATVQILVRIDGRDYMGFRGDIKRVARHPRFDDQSGARRFGIGIYQTHVLFHTLKYRAIK